VSSCVCAVAPHLRHASFAGAGAAPARASQRWPSPSPSRTARVPLSTASSTARWNGDPFGLLLDGGGFAVGVVGLEELGFDLLDL
jgi:hypothetical protein